jgi:hypothetical protein
LGFLAWQIETGVSKPASSRVWQARVMDLDSRLENVAGALDNLS